MESSHSHFQLKITVARLLELSYRQDKGLTARLIKNVGPLRLSVDQDGNARLSGSAGAVKFSASEAIQELGLSFRGVDVAFGASRDGRLCYRASYAFEGITLSVSGSFDIDKLIEACSGLLCRAARALGNRQGLIDQQIKQAMGR